MLCAATKGFGYKNSSVHRVLPSFCIHGGDIINGDGTGGRSIYGRSFPDESFELRHALPGVVSMANKGPDTNNSQFFITLTQTKWLDGVHVAFGAVVEGFRVVKKIEAVGTYAGKTTAKVMITDCGEFLPGMDVPEGIAGEQMSAPLRTLMFDDVVPSAAPAVDVVTTEEEATPLERPAPNEGRGVVNNKGKGNAKSTGPATAKSKTK